MNTDEHGFFRNQSQLFYPCLSVSIRGWQSGSPHVVSYSFSIFAAMFQRFDVDEYVVDGWHGGADFVLHGVGDFV